MKKLFIVLISILLLTPTIVYADSASSSIVMDINSGRVLYSNNINNKRLIASITKIMTCLIAMENGNLKQEVVAGEEILTMYGSNIYLELNEKMTLEDLLYGLMLRSGNDAAVVIANHISKNEKDFVELMNQKAKEIGMKNTIFSNCHGLDEETKNYSTAYDMAILTRYVYKKYPEFRKISATYKHEVVSDNKTYLWHNRNKLLKQYEFCTGGKTGYTPSAGKTLVTTAKKDNLELVTVSLNDGDMYSNHQNLYENIYLEYKNYKIVNKDTYELDDNLFKDTLYLKKSFSYPLTEEEKESIKTILKITKTNKYKSGDKVGEVVIQLEKKEITSIPVYVKIKKETKGFFGRLFG